MSAPHTQRDGTGARIARHATASHRDGRRETRLLSDWNAAGAYVLLGDPGSGKTQSMRAEADACGGVYVRAEDFVNYRAGDDVGGRTLFIDGVDEMRARSLDGRPALEGLWNKLADLGPPPFRLSCREYDWRAQDDLARFARLAPQGIIHELHMEPLSRDEQQRILESRPNEVPDAVGFLDRADEHGVADLLGNPLLLELMITAVVSAGRWPHSRREVYGAACRELARERSPSHLEVDPRSRLPVDEILDDAGLLCAVLLLSGKAAYTDLADGRHSSISWRDLPVQLGLRDPRAVFASKIFVTENGESVPRHRSIAEYLAAKAVAASLKEGLPLVRLLALMQGADGRIVEPLRGLLGWLAVHHLRDRERLIRLDPLAVILNGDVGAFSGPDKVVLLEALRDEAKRDPWFRGGQWVDYPFAPLASPDMADVLAQVLTDHSPNESHQALVTCVFDALGHGQPLPSLREHLEAWIKDGSVSSHNRLGALRAWWRDPDVNVAVARGWLDKLHADLVPDDNARLAGELLNDLYPEHVTPPEVLRYWPSPGAVDTNHLMPRFWLYGLVAQTPQKAFGVLADSWIRLQLPVERAQHDNAWSRLRSAIVANALEHCGDEVDDAHLLAWLGIPIDQYGSSRLDMEADAGRIATWLGERPERFKAVLALEWRQAPTDEASARIHYRMAHEKTHGAPLPRDWLRWLLLQASDAPSAAMAEYCFVQVAQAVVDPPLGMDVPTPEEVERWVADNAKLWPQADKWLAAHWKRALDDDHLESRRLRRQHDAQKLADREARRRAFAPHVQDIATASAPAHVMHRVAGAHEGRFYDLEGESPEQRVQDLLVCDETTARAAVAGLPRVLDRDDLPSAQEVFALERKGKVHLLGSVASLAARLAHEQDPQVVNAWSDDLIRTLVACWLVEDIGRTPEWYVAAAQARPNVVAPWLIRHASARLRKGEPMSVPGLRVLLDKPQLAALALLVLPTLLDEFPRHASEAARRELNVSLLAGLRLLDDSMASRLVRQKADDPSIDEMQRISWLVADLPYRADAAERLVGVVGDNERRATVLGIALDEQGSLNRSLKRVEAPVVARLIEKLGPITRPELKLGTGWVGPDDERRETVHTLIGMLSNNPDSRASAELGRLHGLASLGAWHRTLRQAILSQRGVAREANFTHPPPCAAALMLANDAPANPADLKALTIDQLRDIELHLRGTGGFRLRYFWQKRLEKKHIQNGLRGEADAAPLVDRDLPIAENRCRDLLLDPLGQRLEALNIRVVKEGQAAAEARVDMRIEAMLAGRLHVVPVEVKKEDHRELLTAWRDQLQRLYTIDPAAQGHGIYLVLWFGLKRFVVSDDRRLAGPKDLERHLESLIPEADRYRLSVVVMDLSAPVYPAADAKREPSQAAGVAGKHSGGKASKDGKPKPPRQRAHTTIGPPT